MRNEADMSDQAQACFGDDPGGITLTVESATGDTPMVELVAAAVRRTFDLSVKRNVAFLPGIAVPRDLLIGMALEIDPLTYAVLRGLSFHFDMVDPNEGFTEVQVHQGIETGIEGLKQAGTPSAAINAVFIAGVFETFITQHNVPHAEFIEHAGPAVVSHLLARKFAMVTDVQGLFILTESEFWTTFCDPV